MENGIDKSILDFVRDQDYSSFRDQIVNTLKTKMAEEPKISDYMTKISNAQEKINHFKQIRKLG